MDFPDKTDYKQLLSFMIHELRTTNRQIKESSRLLSLAIRGNRIDEELIRNHVSTIVEQSSGLSSWLAIADLYIDPDKFSREPHRVFSLHQMFYRSQSNFKRLAESKRIRLHLYGIGKFNIVAHPIIDVVPYILLDNAIKYSPLNGSVDISLNEGAEMITAKVSSHGPFADQEELQRVCEAGYRGKHAQMASQIGNGLGLSLLDAICVHHDIGIEILSEAATWEYNGIPYSEFAVVLRFKKA